MADINQCLIDGGFSKEEQLELFGDIDMSNPEAVMAAADEALMFKQNAKRQAKIQINVMNDVMDYYEDFVAKYGDGWEAINGMLTSSYKGRAGTISIEAHANSIRGWAEKNLLEMMEGYKPEKLGFHRDKQGPRNMVRTLFGESVSDPDAVAYAKMWKDVTDQLRDRFNKAGGFVKDLEDWALPQKHDPTKVGAADFEEWKNFIMKRLDFDRMKAAMKNKDESWDDILKSIYDNIRTDGGSSIKVGSVRGMKVANRYQHGRFLHFKNADSWLEYQDKFGSPDTYATLTSHIHQISNDVALIEKFGPNPNTTFRNLSQLATKNHGKDKWGHTNAIWENVKGMGYGDNVKLADTVATIKNWQTATKLGSALLSALPDSWFVGLTARYNGLSTTRTMKRFVSALAQGDKYKQAAARIGMTADYAVDHAAASNRLSEVTGYGATARIADTTIRASGLNHWTHAGKAAFQVEFSVALAELSNKKFGELSDGIRMAFDRYGITRSDWVKIRKADRIKIGNEEMLDPTSLDNDMMSKVTGMILEETRYAIPEPGARVRAIMNQGLQKGTVAGEFARAATTFKSFPITYMTTHMGRMLHGQGNVSRGAYSASLVIGTTLLGTMSVQMKELAKGNTALEWEDPATWGKGFVQGGSGTMIGDFLLNPIEGHGRSFADEAMGPVFSDITTLSKLFLSDVPEAIMGDKEDINDLLANAARVGKSLTPAQLWYNKLIMDRYIFDQVNKSVDQEWRKKERRKEKELRTENNQSKWWRAGEFQPEF